MKHSLKFLFVVLAFVLVAPVAADGPAIVRPDPLVTAVKVGQVFVVKLYVQDVANLYAADVHLQFDPALLEVQDADPAAPGVQIQPLSSFFAPGFVIKKKACNVVDPADPDCTVAGRAWYAAAQLNPTPPATGSGPLAAITFKAIKSGLSQLTVSYQQFSDPKGDPIPSMRQDGAVKVMEGPILRKLHLPLIRR